MVLVGLIYVMTRLVAMLLYRLEQGKRAAAKAAAAAKTHLRMPSLPKLEVMKFVRWMMRPRTKTQSTQVEHAEEKEKKKPSRTLGTQVTITKFGGFEVLITKNAKAFHTRRCNYVTQANEEGIVKCNKCPTCAKGDAREAGDVEIEPEVVVVDP